MVGGGNADRHDPRQVERGGGASAPWAEHGSGRTRAADGPAMHARHGGPSQ